MLFLGVDPGADGAIASVDIDGNVESMCILRKATDREVWHYLIDRIESNDATAIMEKLGGMPRDKTTGRARQSPTTMFKMGQSSGKLLGFLTGAGIRHRLIVPPSWQRKLGLLFPGLSRTEKKRRHNQMAEQLFPLVRVTLSNCDALLLAHLCREERG